MSTSSAETPSHAAAIPAVPLWQPNDQQVRLSEMGAFRRRVNQRFKLKLKDYWQLYDWSIRHPEDFWSFLLEDSAVKTEGDFLPAFSDDPMPHTRWFENLRLNYAQGVLFPRGISPYEDAIIALTETGHKRVMSYGTLRDKVAACAAGLRQAGVQQGDRVAAYIGNVPEAVIIMLACASMGAVFSSGSPDFGFKTAEARFGQIEPKILFASSCYYYNGKRYETLDVVEKLAHAIPSISQVVVVPYPEDKPSLSDSNSVLWQDFLLDGAELSFEMLPFDHPLYILYSSGTTGLPKAIVHRAGGAFLSHYKEQRLHSNICKGDRVFYFTTCGWMMWNWLVSCLTQGCEILLYEGSPSYPNMEHLWEVAGELNINFFGTSARFLHGCRSQNIVPQDIADLSAINTVASTGSPLSPEDFRWCYEAVKQDMHLASISGGTDIVSCFMLGVPTLPVYAGEIQSPGLGVDLAAFDEDGRAQPLGKTGELVCRAPLPSMPLYFWQDEDFSRYKAAYFDNYPEVWQHGDLIELTPHRGVNIYGRSDATLNPAGVRIGTAEIYRPLESIPEILEAVAVAKKIEGDEVIWLFVVLQEGQVLHEKLEKTIKTTLRSQASPRHVPKAIYAVPDLPRTRSGKSSEIAVSRIVNGRPVSNHNALANPEVLQVIGDIIAGKAEQVSAKEAPKPSQDEQQATKQQDKPDAPLNQPIQKPIQESVQEPDTIPTQEASPADSPASHPKLSKELTKHLVHAKDKLEATPDEAELDAEQSGDENRVDSKKASRALTKHLVHAKSKSETAEVRETNGKAQGNDTNEAQEQDAKANLEQREASANGNHNAALEGAGWQPHTGQAFASAVLKRHLQSLKDNQQEQQA